MSKDNPKICPECEHEFQGNGWDGIDAHWKFRHEHIVPYSIAWPLIQSGKYKRRPKRQPREDFNQAAFRAVQETIRRSES
ncbi:MAG TPA: hypothetical protein VMT20_25170 [Terriglobia bacterium]|nr:hypothetical protein [Terriglobia bacterium]